MVILYGRLVQFSICFLGANMQRSVGFKHVVELKNNVYNFMYHLYGFVVIVNDLIVCKSFEVLDFGRRG